MKDSQSATFLIAAIKSSAAAVVCRGSAHTANVEVDRRWHGDHCQVSVSNHGSMPVAIEEIVAFDLRHRLDGLTQVYGEGFTMLGQLGGTLAEPVDLSYYTDRKLHRIPEPEDLRTAYGALLLRLAERQRVLLGAASSHRFAVRFSYDSERLRVSYDGEGLILRPGESWQLDELVVLSGTDREPLFDQLATAIAAHHPRLVHDVIPTGWCSWYCFGPEVTADDVKANTRWIAQNLPELRYVQIDDGYQPWMGDWLDTGEAFGGDVFSVLDDIRAHGLEPAIWVAPFIASPESRVFAEHPDWMVQDANGKPLRSDIPGFGGWRQGPWYVLDGTHPDVQEHLRSVFTTMRREWGCTYFKLDATYWGAIHGGVHHDRDATRIEAYRRGMEAVLRGTGDAFVLGCNHPLWPSLGLIHGSRSSMDVIAPDWEHLGPVSRETLLRNWQNGRLWWNDPDVLMLKAPDVAVVDQAGTTHTGDAGSRDTTLRAATVYASGGSVISGDDLHQAAPTSLTQLEALLPPVGVAASFQDEQLEIGITTLPDATVFSVFNWTDDPAPRTIQLPPGKQLLTDKLAGQTIGIHEHTYDLGVLPPGTAVVLEARPA
ncbi:glycoside hydrolase family 36 protein [Jiangella alba]|uniref:Alpha-galactosidase n=1 Tax=Jiangella alba TaxID=561176 RepID=A0A1H5JJI5_9ACTN|nr:glycoside hydrolase family 36 protein [Jiangella alba]SEE52161.1 alpha-galactosidase [Jiangella alba]